MNRSIRLCAIRSLIIPIGFLAAVTLSAETVLFESELDWTIGRITTIATVPLGTIDTPPVAARTAATDMIRSALPEHLSQFLSSVPLDSSAMIGDLIRNSAQIRREFNDFAEESEPSASYTDSKLSKLTLRFEHALYPNLAEMLILHSKALGHEPSLGFSPTTEYTGLVIYAKGLFPVHGEPGRESMLVPAILPKIYDETMSVLLESGMVEPRTAIESGVVAYSNSVDISQFRDRIGEIPLVTMARRIFGTNRTDVVVPSEIADRLLSSEANRRLLELGRVLIICDLPIDE